MEVTIVQSDIFWEDPIANRSKFNDILTRKSMKTDLVVLPEMFTTGFSMDAVKLAESMEGESVKWMIDLARSEGFAIAGSLIIKRSGLYYNSLVFTDGSGLLETYDKGHLFMMEKENNYFTKGSKPCIFSYKGFSINLQICYDLRFPVWSRNVNNNYDILIYVASWPKSRRDVWNTLLKARAIENQCYVIGVNRIGIDGTGITYSGDSVIIGPRGQIMAELEPNAEGQVSAILSIDELQLFRAKFPVWKDADKFNLTD